MNNFNIKEYISGSIASAIQTAAVYPLDTLKIYKQTNINKPLSIKNIYKGIYYPLLFDICAGSVLFGTYYNMRKSYSKEYSSIVTGIVTGIIINPFDIYKIKHQTHLSHKTIPLYKGCLLTIARETIGNYIYFGTYEYLKNRGVPIPISGGIAGAAMWTTIYPIDNIKTNYQIKNINIKNYIKNNYKNLFNGYKYALLRAVPANVIVFSVYEYIYCVLCARI